MSDRLDLLAPSFRARVAAAVDALRSRGCAGRAGMVLGSGLGNVADAVEGGGAVNYGELPGFPAPTVAGHGGRVVWGTIDGVSVVVLQGRLHPYEGLPWEVLLLPSATLACLDLSVVLLTNAAGGLNLYYQPGDLMVIRDHVDLHFHDPLRGLLADPWRGGAFAVGRHPGFAPLYDPELSRGLVEAAAAAGIAVHSGVYASMWGPTYEARAEIGVLRRLAADAVGMSTAPEAVLLRALGVSVVGLSCITNPAHETGQAPLSHQEVIDTGLLVRDRMAEVLRGFLGSVGRK